MPSLIQRAHIAADVAGPAPQRLGAVRPHARPATPRRLALAADLREALETDGPRRVLPAQGRAGHRHRAGCRGAGALEPPPPRPGAARRVHRHRRAHRRHPGADHDRDAHGRSPSAEGGATSASTCRVAVNLSARNLLDLHLVDDVAAAIDEAGVPPATLTLELTESMVMSESQRSVDVLSGLQRAGRAPVVRRLRHRLLVARPPAPAADRRDQDRQVVHRPHGGRRERPGHRPLGAGARARPRARHGGRGRRVARGLGPADQARLRPGPGLRRVPAADRPASSASGSDAGPPDEFAYLDDRYADEIAAYQRPDAAGDRPRAPVPPRDPRRARPLAATADDASPRQPTGPTASDRRRRRATRGPADRPLRWATSPTAIGSGTVDRGRRERGGRHESSTWPTRPDATEGEPVVDLAEGDAVVDRRGRAPTSTGDDRAAIRRAARGSSARCGRPGTSRRPPPPPPARRAPPRSSASISSPSGGQVRLRRPAGPPSASRSSGTGSPPKSQMTVRSLGSQWNVRPLSTAQMRPSSPARQWPPLRSALLASRSKQQIVRRAAWRAGVLEQREVVRLDVEGHEPLQRPDAERQAVARAARSRARGPSPARPTARRRPPRGGRGRRGSPTAAARPGGACTRPAGSPSRG